MTNGDAFTVTVAVSDPDGADDILFGRLESSVGDEIVEFERTGAGAYEAVVSWEDISAVTDLNGVGELNEQFVVRFYDAGQNQAAADLAVGFECEGQGICMGQCSLEAECLCDFLDQDLNCLSEENIVVCGEQVIGGACADLTGGATSMCGTSPDGSGGCYPTVGEECQDADRQLSLCARNGEVDLGLGCIDSVCAPVPACRGEGLQTCTSIGGRDTFIQCLDAGLGLFMAGTSCEQMIGNADSTCSMGTGCMQPEAGGVCADEVVVCEIGMCVGETEEGPGACEEP